MKIGVYIGSFNPPHRGHIEIAHKIPELGLADQVLFVPTGCYWGKQSLMPIEARIEMLRTACTDETVAVETQCNEIPYTAELLPALEQEYPGNELLLILGADSLVRFSEWYKADLILKNYRFLVIPRRGYDAEMLLQGIGKQDAIVVEDIPELPFSSTEIRALEKDSPQLEQLMTPEILRIYRTLDAQA